MRLKRVLIAPDKFKGTLSAGEACMAIASGWRSIRPGDEMELLPMSDGGDGFGDLLARLTQARVRRLKNVDAAHRPVMTDWWWEPGEKLAIIESARVIGLAMLPPGKFHPFELDRPVMSGAGGSLRGLGGDRLGSAYPRAI